ncbi:MAG TPA: hypothetical protein VMS17_07105 [Gemmataceae bacterium]|nr:hypothetical protein [Gemmataceae bacterium]
MRCNKRVGVALIVAGAAVWLAVRADEPKPDAGALTVVDASGKEQKVTGSKFTLGTRRLAWLAPAGGLEKPAPAATPAGPEALEFRDDDSTLYEDGILTLIPLDRLRSLEWDNDKEEVTAHIAVGPKADDEATLSGPTGYKGINKIVLEAEVDKGDMGVADFKYLGGVPKGIRGLKFPSAKAPEASPAGRPAVVTTVYKDKKTTNKVADLQPLYKTAAGEQLSPVLWFKKTLKVDVSKIQKIAVNDSEDEPAWTVTDKDGEQTLTPLLKTTIDGKPAQLAGLLGRVPEGYKLFPAHTISEVQFDAEK